VFDSIDSLHPPTDGDSADVDWLDELEVRAAAYESGDAPAEDWRVSLERVRQRLHDGNAA
jgi:hypothetical protein